VLSACQTAAGDERAALGLAGVAVRAGARSAVATLWSVSDVAAADLMTHFYASLRQPGVSRARALQAAQRALLEQRALRHPFYWSPFVLINSWL
jgi:CHAT domain-containing protein